MIPLENPVENKCTLCAIPTTGERWFVFLAASTICIAYALYNGQDINWDQQNYHYYSIYAVLNGRLGIDVAPAQVQTWLNPLGSVLPYFLMAYAPPRLASAILAVIAALTICLIYELAARIFAPARAWGPAFYLPLRVMSALGAVTAPIFLSETGTTFNDYLIWLILLIGLVAVIDRNDTWPGLLLAGCMFGLAVGMKLTASVYCIGFGVAMLADLRDGPAAITRRVVLIAAGFVPSFALFGGIWMLHLYLAHGNPTFPFYNHIFRSPDYLPAAMTDLRFVVRGLEGIWGTITGIAAGRHPTAEIYFADIRFLFTALLLVIAAPILLKRMFVTSAHEDGVVDWNRARFLIVFALATFVCWILTFGIERYALGLEQLALPCMLCCLAALVHERRTFLLASVMATGLVTITSRPADWRRTPFTETWFEMRVPAELRAPRTLFIMLSDWPMAYVIPFMPASNVFVRLEGNMPLTPNEGLGGRAQAAIEAQTGDIRTLSSPGHRLEQSAATLLQFGLKPAVGPCFLIRSRADDLESCPLTKASEPAP